MKLILIVLSVLVSAGLCNGGEYHMSDGIKFFFAYPVVHNWYEAMRFCSYYGMYPVSLHSYEEEQIVLNAIKKFREQNSLSSTVVHFWTSGTDLGHNINEFYWTATGQPMIYTNWVPNNPTNAAYHAYTTTKDCLLLNGDYNHLWFDEHCHLRYHTICQDKFLKPKRFNDNCEL